MRDRIAVLATLTTLALVVASGCLGGGTTGDPTTTPSDRATGESTTPTPTPTTAVTATPTDTITGYETPDWRTRLWVEPLAAERDPTDVPADSRTTFENLSDRRQQEFLSALDGDGYLEDPRAWNQAPRYVVVRYEGTWYRVRVVVR